MIIKDIKMNNTPHIYREHCSWSKCYRKEIAEHHVKFKIRKEQKNKVTWINRLMGLCDKHRGDFNRKYLGAKPKKHQRVK